MDRGMTERKRPMKVQAFAIGPSAIHTARSAGHAGSLPQRISAPQRPLRLKLCVLG
jgi:hypothetical protein